jgi:HEAT repeat protein
MVMLESLSMVSRKMIDRRFWQRFSREQRLLHIDLKQVRYTTMEGAEETREDQEIPLKGDKDVPIRDSAKLLDQDQELDEQDYAQIPQVIRSLITAASNIKLYPPESKGVKNSIEAFQKALGGFLLRRPALTLAQVGETLLVNGASIDTSGFKGIADGFLKLLGKIGLSSLTFLKKVSTRELKSFITALGRTKADELNSEFWQRFAGKQQFSGIFFDQTLYEILEHQAGIDSEREEPVEEPVSEEPQEEEAISETPLEEKEEEQQTEAFLKSVAQQLDDFILKGDKAKVQQSIDLLFQGFAKQTPQIREKVIHICDDLLKDLDLVSQPQFVEMLTDKILLVLTEEESPDLLKGIGILLSQTASNLIRFDDYQRANRILKHLQKRRQQLQDNKDEQIQPQEIIFIQDLDQKIQGILLDDFKSQDPSRMQQTARLLGNLGPVALPVLIEVIKKEDNLRLRQIASRLLGKLGSKAAKILKRELVIEGFVEERVRILEVIDNITKDLKTELSYAMGDRNIKVRKEAFLLAERLNDEEVTLLLLDYANHEDIGLAMVAIDSLGKLKSAGAVDGLVSLLESTKETERLIACCKALGRIADPGGIEPLTKILAPVSFLSLRKKQSSIARATAAFALTQISHPRAAEVLDLYVEDRDPRVRRAAINKMNTPMPSSLTKDD